MRDGRLKPQGPALRPGPVQLARWIHRMRLTQAEAAEEIRISRVKVNQYVNDEARPSLETAFRIQDVTGIPARAWCVDEADEGGESPALAAVAEGE